MSVKRPDLLLKDAETGKWMKVFVQMTQDDNDDYFLESQLNTSSNKSCHRDDIESYDDNRDHSVTSEGDSDYCGDDHENDENQDSYFFLTMIVIQNCPSILIVRTILIVRLSHILIMILIVRVIVRRRRKRGGKRYGQRTRVHSRFRIVNTVTFPLQTKVNTATPLLQSKHLDKIQQSLGMFSRNWD